MANRLIGIRTIRTPQNKAKILDAMTKGHSMTKAAKIAGVGRNALHEWKRDDEEFRHEVQAAFAAGTDTLADEARKRAFAGSDALLIFLLKSRDPATYNRRMLEGVVTHVDAGAQPQPDRPYVVVLPSNGRDAVLEYDVKTNAVERVAADVTRPVPTSPAPAPAHDPDVEHIPVGSSWYRVAKRG